jgi:hypothetical protein
VTLPASPDHLGAPNARRKPGPAAAVAMAILFVGPLPLLAVVVSPFAATGYAAAFVLLHRPLMRFISFILNFGDGDGNLDGSG